MHHGWHSTHRYDIQVLTTHASTWVHRYSSLLQWSVPLGQRGHVSGSFAYFAQNVHCTVTIDLLLSYWKTQTNIPLPHPFTRRPFSHYIHSHRLAAEMWTTMKNNLPGKSFWVFPSICTGFVNTCPTVFPIIIFCNPGVHYETPCILFWKLYILSIWIMGTMNYVLH